MQKSSKASIIKQERKKKRQRKKEREFNENGSKSYAIVKNSVIYVEIQEQTRISTTRITQTDRKSSNSIIKKKRQQTWKMYFGLANKINSIFGLPDHI